MSDVPAIILLQLLQALAEVVQLTAEAGPVSGCRGFTHGVVVLACASRSGSGRRRFGALRRERAGWSRRLCNLVGLPPGLIAEDEIQRILEVHPHRDVVAVADDDAFEFRYPPVLGAQVQRLDVE